MNYSFFLFCKLYELYKDFEDVEYDLQFQFLSDKFHRYVLSDFNVVMKGEYECMIDFIKNDIGT